MSRRIWAGLLFACCAMAGDLFAAWGTAVQTVPLQRQSAEIHGRAELGTAVVEGIGPVRLEVWRQDKRLLIHAFSADGSLIGQAESVPGMRVTPLYLRTMDGLKRLDLQWGAGGP